MAISLINDEVVLTSEQIAKFERDYKITANMQKTCGQIIYGIIEEMGLKSTRKTKYGIDVKKVSDLTGLNNNIIYLLKNPDCRLEKSHVVSFAMGLGLDVHATAYILQANGMTFNTNDRTDKAYVTLIEQHKGTSIEDCNAILRDLGITQERHYLGSKERGEYNL